MKIEEMVMVIYNQKGIEKNFLCSFEHFIKKYATDACDSYFQCHLASQLNSPSLKNICFPLPYGVFASSHISLQAGTCLTVL